ncbi:MAG: hypothetical protein AAF990_27385 [Bacteroidota bacterium]
MKKYLFIFLLTIAIIGFQACSDDDMNTMDTVYTSQIISPNTDDKMVGDKISIAVDFEEQGGGTIHHVNVRIVSADDGTEIYNKPDEAHVHEESGKYEFRDELTLDVADHSNWLLISKVWGHQADAHAVSDTIRFHVHPAMGGGGPAYHTHFHSPNTDDKKVGDKIDIAIDFSDHHGGTIHHVNVRLVNKADGSEIYNKPDAAHVHEESGKYEFRDELDLNVGAHSDWLLIAKVWGHEAGAHQVSDTLEFHVHPQ